MIWLGLSIFGIIIIAGMLLYAVWLLIDFIYTIFFGGC